MDRSRTVPDRGHPYPPAPLMDEPILPSSPTRAEKKQYQEELLKFHLFAILREWGESGREFTVPEMLVEIRLRDENAYPRTRATTEQGMNRAKTKVHYFILSEMEDYVHRTETHAWFFHLDLNSYIANHPHIVGEYVPPPPPPPITPEMVGEMEREFWREENGIDNPDSASDISQDEILREFHREQAEETGMEFHYHSTNWENWIYDQHNN